MANEPIFIDTHAHIYYDDLYSNIESVLKDCEANNVRKIYMPNVDQDSIEKMLDLEDRFPDRCLAMMGLHPCSVKDNFEKDLLIVESWLGKRRFCAVGEIGIDYHWTREFDSQQEAAFVYQLDLALKYDLPIAIHSRNSIDKIIELLSHRGLMPYKGVLHCFTGNEAQANQLVELGLYLGIGGVVTYKNSGVDKAIANLSMEHLVLETDSPYLAPIPYRGKPNTPAYLTLIAQKIADIKSISLEEVAYYTTINANNLFGRK